MKGMGRPIRALAAVLAGLALVAALPAPCGCAPPVGVSAADRGCCDESPVVADVGPSPAGPATAPVLVAALRVEAPSALLVPARPAVTPAFSPPPAILRI
jgi:hypothetical protein